MNKRLAERDEIFAIYCAPYHIVVAQGLAPTPCYLESIEPTREPDLFEIFWEQKPGACAEVMTQYRCFRALNLGGERDYIYIRHARGIDKVRVVPVSQDTVPIPEVEQENAPALQIA